MALDSFNRGWKFHAPHSFYTVSALKALRSQTTCAPSKVTVSKRQAGNGPRHPDKYACAARWMRARFKRSAFDVCIADHHEQVFSPPSLNFSTRLQRIASPISCVTRTKLIFKVRDKSSNN